MNVDHVQPVETVAPGRGARWHTWLAVALPLVVLVTVATGGVLGGAADPADGGGAAGPIGAVRPTPAVSNPAVATPSEAPDPLSLELPDGFPTDAVGLPVRSVAATADLIRQDRLRESVVAVAGWLTIRPASADCPNEYDRGTGPTALCPRETILVATPEPVLELSGPHDVVRLRAPGPHLHPIALPGVSLRQVAGRQYSGLATALRPVPVVVIARVADPRLPACRPSAPHCGEGLALERVIWADGEWQDRRALLTTPPFEGADPSPRARRERIDRAVRGAGTILSEILVPRDALPGVDATAGRAIDTTADGAVWYVRFLVRVAGPGGTYPRDVGWAVIDDVSGEVVAADPARPSADG